MTFDGQGQYEVDGQNYLTDRDRPRGNFESVSDNYFATLGLKILEGRDFTIDDCRLETTGGDREREFCAKILGQSKRARASGPDFQSRSNRNRGEPLSVSCPTH